MIVRRYVAPCPACGVGRVRLQDVPSRSYVANYLPGPRPPVEGDDRWRYAILDACLCCGFGAGGEPLFERPAGIEEIDDRDVMEHLRRGLAQVARGSRPEIEAAWREALAGCYQSAGDVELAARELREAIELLPPDRGCTDARLMRLLFALGALASAFSGAPDDRAFVIARLSAHLERCFGELGEVPVIAGLLVQLAGVLRAAGHVEQACSVLERAWQIYERAPDPAADPDAWGGPDAVAAASQVRGSFRDQGIALVAQFLLPVYAELGLASELAACEARALAVWSRLYGKELARAMLASAREPR